MAKLTLKNKKEISELVPSSVKTILEKLDQLVLLSNVFESEVGLAFEMFLEAVEKKEPPKKILKKYSKLWNLLVNIQSRTEHSVVGNLLQNYFLERLLEDDNLFNRQAEQVSFEKILPSLKQAYAQELEIIQKVLKINWEVEVQKKLVSKNALSVYSLDSGEVFEGLDRFGLVKSRNRIKEKLLNAKGTVSLNEIADFFYKNGWGLFGQYRAFRWEVSGSKGGRLEGIDNVDPIQLKNLIGYDEARKALLENIEGFVAGKGGNNVLIYGERGTGKSSTVKALLNAYYDKGLRLVEVMAAHLNEYQDILHCLRRRREKFILFVDDLSFEGNETTYKGLKALLEGAIEATPLNVILIATSNRRHLIREFFDDRVGSIQKEGEIHGADTIEEKLSLSDRFGLVISFLSPNQDIYLKIVENWAKVEDISISPEELHLKSLQWSRFNNGRSGRTARQFINDLKGKMT